MVFRSLLAALDFGCEPVESLSSRVVLKSPHKIILGLYCDFMSLRMLDILVLVFKAAMSVSRSPYMLEVVHIFPCSEGKYYELTPRANVSF